MKHSYILFIHYIARYAQSIKSASRNSPILLWFGIQVALTTSLCSSMQIVTAIIKMLKLSFAEVTIACIKYSNITTMHATHGTQLYMYGDCGRYSSKQHACMLLPCCHSNQLAVDSRVLNCMILSFRSVWKGYHTDDVSCLPDKLVLAIAKYFILPQLHA